MNRIEQDNQPVKFYEIIESVTDTPRIELFARNKRAGWDSWGNEVPNEYQLNISAEKE